MIKFNYKKIDETTISDHWYLESSDRCIYAMEYTSGKGYSFSAANSFISNLKKKQPYSESDRRYKGEAIAHAVDQLADRLRQTKISCFLVPIPPSRMRGDEEYDDRMIKILDGMQAELDADKFHACDLFERRHNIPRKTRDIKLLRESCRVRRENFQDMETLKKTLKKYDRIMIFDDVLTTGAHFKATQMLLSDLLKMPAEEFEGLFLARRILPEEDPAAVFGQTTP